MKGAEMMDIKALVEDFKKLTTEECEILIRELTKILRGDTDTLKTFLTNERFSGGRVCPLCGSTTVVRNGHTKNKTRRYFCRDCHKSFVITTNSITFGTHKSLEVWEKFVSYMVYGMPSLRDLAAACGISKNTAFAWRHKIFDTLHKMADNVVLDGIVEADEMFFPVSYKGNHVASKSFVMPRPAHVDGVRSTKRGISRDQVCVVCAVNRDGLSICKVSNLGRVSTENLFKAFNGRIKPGSTFCTDKMHAYKAFARENELTHIETKAGTSKSGIYGIDHVDGYHSGLKGYMKRFRGVATKYLNNYIVWNNFVNFAKNTKPEKLKILMSFALSTPIKITNEAIPARAPLPLLT